MPLTIHDLKPGVSVPLGDLIRLYVELVVAEHEGGGVACEEWEEAKGLIVETLNWWEVEVPNEAKVASRSYIRQRKEWRR